MASAVLLVSQCELDVVVVIVAAALTITDALLCQTKATPKAPESLEQPAEWQIDSLRALLAC